MVINGGDLFFANPIKGMIDRKVHEHGVSRGLGEAGYDIRIKQEIQFCSTDFVRHHVLSTERNEHGHVVSYHKKMGRFTLASSIEEFDMPSDMIGIVHDKSTWARQGLSVFNTVIENGWKGFLTLELVYHGYDGLVIPAGAAIAQVVFHRTSEHAWYEGKYQNQANEPVAAIASK
jgi:dCTP deaminase